jgi:hypothetical protein
MPGGRGIAHVSWLLYEKTTVAAIETTNTDSVRIEVLLYFWQADNIDLTTTIISGPESGFAFSVEWESRNDGFYLARPGPTTWLEHLSSTIV